MNIWSKIFSKQTSKITPTLAKMLYNADKENFYSVRVAKDTIKAGWIGIMESKDGILLYKVDDLRFIPEKGNELSLFDGMFGCAARYTAVNGKEGIYLEKHD